jgi:hypothetical protein
VTEDVVTTHGAARGFTTGRGAKPRGALRAGAQTGSGGKPGGTTCTDKGADMGGTAADVPVSKMSKSLVIRGEVEKGKIASSNATCR